LILVAVHNKCHLEKGNVSVICNANYFELLSFLKKNLIHSKAMNTAAKLLISLLFFHISYQVIIFSDHEVKYNQKHFIANVSLLNEKDGDLLINFTSQFVVKMLKYIHTYSINIANGDRDRNYETQIFKSTIDFCKVGKGTRGNFVVKMLMEDFEKIADFDRRLISCPVPIGIYSFNNLRISDKFLPSFLLRNLSFFFKLDGQGKVNGERGLVKLFSFQIHGKTIVK